MGVPGRKRRPMARRRDFCAVCEEGRDSEVTSWQEDEGSMCTNRSEGFIPNEVRGCDVLPSV